MREILFRGKRIDNGEWVHGSVIVFPCGGTCIAKKTELDFELEQIEVDPATIAQCTNLTDKNNAKIFEGDIIWGTGSKANMDNFVIRWSEAICGFTAGEGKRVWPNLNQATIGNYEIVGNIHDNPELLEWEI